jgi:hypothetical protein
LADCFLQGVYYLTLKNMITIKQEAGADAGADADADADAETDAEL